MASFVFLSQYRDTNATFIYKFQKHENTFLKTCFGKTYAIFTLQSDVCKALNRNYRMNKLTNYSDVMLRWLISPSDLLASFEMIHQTMKRNLRNYDQTGNLETEIAHLAQDYVSSYKPTSTDLKKHHIVRNTRNNREIIVLKPGKGNGVVIMIARYIRTTVLI